jgi:hypothetical protein
MAKSKQEWKSKARLAKKETAVSLYEDWDREELIEFIEELKAENEELKHLQESEKEDKSVLVAGSGESTERNILSGYNKDWTWVSKMVFVLRQMNRPLKSKELLVYLEGVDDNIKFFADKTKTFSSLLNKATKYQRVLEYKIRGVKGYFYILPEWMEGEKLREEFKKLINEYE